MVRFATARALAMAVALAIAATRVDDARATDGDAAGVEPGRDAVRDDAVGADGERERDVRGDGERRARGWSCSADARSRRGEDANDVWEYDLRWNASAGIYDGMWTRLHEGGTRGGGETAREDWGERVRAARESVRVRGVRRVGGRFRRFVGV